VCKSSFGIQHAGWNGGGIYAKGCIMNVRGYCIVLYCIDVMDGWMDGDSDGRISIGSAVVSAVLDSSRYCLCEGRSAGGGLKMTSEERRWRGG
jgi:hypothetical protein